MIEILPCLVNLKFGFLWDGWSAFWLARLAYAGYASLGWAVAWAGQAWRIPEHAVRQEWQQKCRTQAARKEVIYNFTTQN